MSRTAALHRRNSPQWVEKRPSVETNMRLISPTKEQLMDASTKTIGCVTLWNKGKLLGQKPPLRLKEIWAIRIRLQLDHRTRELALFNLAIGIATAQVKPEQFLFPSRVSESPHLSTRQSSRIL